MKKLFFYLFFTLALSSMGPASASTVINFLCGNNTGIPANCTIGEDQFRVTASNNATSTGASFLFENIGAFASSITDIYFDDAPTAIFDFTGSTPGISSGSGVAYSAPAAPPSPPGNGFEVAYSADSDEGPPGVQANGINNWDGTGTNNEWLQIDVTYSATGTFDALLAALTNETFGIALHAQAFPDGESEWFATSVVPVPAAVWLFGTALLGFIGFSRRTQL